MYIDFACLCVSVPTVCLCPWRPEAGVEAPGTGVTECEPPTRCWESNLDPLEEQPMLLTAEPTPQSNAENFLKTESYHTFYMCIANCSVRLEQVHILNTMFLNYYSTIGSLTQNFIPVSYNLTQNLISLSCNPNTNSSFFIFSLYRK